MFLSNWLIFKIVLASLGLTDYPLASDLELVYDGANKLYLRGGMVKNASNVVLYRGETSYDATASISGDAPLSKTILGGGTNYYLGSGYGGPRSFNVNNGDQTVLVAGARGYNSNQGLIYIYERKSKNRGDWELKQTIYGNLGTNASFGMAVSINDAGDRIFVSADQYSSTTGRVLVYDRGSDGLFPDTPTHTLTGSNGSGYAFGFSIDCNGAGDKLIVGARNETATERGAHHLYELINGTWTRTWHRVEGTNNRRYGWAVAMNKVGDRIVVSGSYPNGWIWIHHYENGSWVTKTQISNPVASNEFGWSVSMNDVGDRVAVGCNTIRAYIYDYNGTSWSLFTSKTDNPAGYAHVTLTPKGDYIAIHGHDYDPFGTNPGAAYIYQISDTGTLTLVRTFTGEASSDNLGWHVYMSDDLEVIVMGAQGNDEGGSDAGKLYVYSFDTWAENFYITQPGTYRADLQICGIDYKTNTVEVTGTPTSSKVTQISTGGLTSLVLTQDGYVYAWGYNLYGQCGQGSTSSYENTPVKVKGVGGTGYLSNIIKITTGYNHCMALANDGTVYAWGYNNVGQIGDGTSGNGTDKYTPVVVSYSGDPVSNISAGAQHSALTTTTGKVYCWGNNGNSELGDKSITNRSTPVQVVGVNNIGNLTGIRDVTCGDSFTHAIKDSDGSVYGWGKRTYGMLGDGTNSGTIDEPVPVILASDSSAVTGIVQVNAGDDHTVMLKSDGTVYACGYGVDGEQGDGATDNNDTGLVQVLGVGGSGYLTGITQIATCLSTSLALKSDGTMYVWGSNADGQNGLGTVGGTNPTTPVAITTLTGVNAIAADGKPFHFIASKPDGSIYCWGRGDYGSIGDGTNTADQGTPTQVVAGAGPSVDGKFNLFTEPRLTFDNYNKFSILHGLSYTSSKFAYYSNVYDVGALTDKLYIDKTGDYTSVTFDTSSNVAYFSNTSIQNVTVISDYIGEYGIANYSTYNGANNVGWTMDEWSLRPLRWNRGDRNNSLYVPVPASSSDPFAIDTLLYFYVQSLVANGFSSSSENFPFPTKNGVLWEVDMKNVELSCYNNNARVTGSSLESTYSTGNNSLFFELQCNKNGTNAVTIYVYYNRTNSIGKFFDFWWSISNNNNGVTNTETICLIQNVDLSNNTVLKYGWYTFDITEGKPEFYLSIGGQTVSEKVSFSLNNAYKNFHDETYGGCEVADPVGPYNSNYSNHMGWPFRHFLGGDTRSGVGDNSTTEARTNLKRGLIFDMMYFKYDNVFEKIPKIDFDTYNKLSIQNITPTATTLKYGSNTYDLGTISNVYIENPGTYEAAIKASDKFALVSNVVNTVGTTLAEYVVDTTIYGTVQSGQTHGINQGGFGNNTILNADGTRLLVTDPLNYPSGLGRAYIYHLESGSWVLKQTWDNPTGSGQRFADGVCMNEDGTRVFLMHSASEKVYTYEYASGAWPTANTGTHTISPGTIGGEYEGMACNKAGDVLLIGQGNVNTAKIYRRASATSWTQDSGGSFSKGRGVAMNGAGTRAFIGNSADATVHMTEWNGSTWSSLTQIIDESYSTWPCTMMSDSAGETLVIVSGGGDSNSGNSGIYERDSGTGSWSRAQGVNGDTEIYGMRLPSISYDGTMVLVGSYRHDSGKGRAQLWQKSGGSWSLTKEYLNPDASPASTDNFGSGCGIARTTKDKFVIGMEGDDTAGTDYGSVRVYTNAIPKYLDFDTYNKLSIQNITPTATTLKYGSNTYDIGTISNVYIENPGTYEAAIKASDKFVLASNTATYQVHPNTAYSNYRSIGGISAASTSLHNENITTTYSVTMWAKSASGSYILRTANSDSSTNPTNTHGIFGTDSTGKVSVPSWTSNNSISAEFNGTSVRDEWHFFGFEFEGSSIKLHLDGAVPISSTTAYTGQTHNRMRFDSPSVFTDGTRLAEFAVYNRALTDAEFVSIYNNGKPNGPDNVSSGRVSWFKCLSGAMATNSGSGGDFDATITEDVDVPSTWLDPTPYLTHDTYNKLSIQNITPTATTLKYDSNTYDIGTATDIYIANSGTYEIETKDANTFAFASNVVSGSITYPPSSTVNAGNFTLAFRHGTGTTDTSSNNCTLYSGMTTGDYDWGTVNSVTSSSTETTYNVTFSQMNNVNYLVLAGGGGGGNDYPEGGGGGGGMLDGTETSIPGNTYDIVVGNGGGRRVNGTNSSFYTLDSVGGGCGRSGVGADGGSGGGGRDNSAGGSGVAGPPRQGYNGGTGYIIDYGSGGGGGGAGGNGGNAGNHVGGTGGTGRVWSFNNTRYGGGGGGGTRNSAGGSGGAGGGGNGGQRLADGSNGTNYLGGGGGCKASGGSGTVILNFDATQSSTSPRYFSFDTYNKLVISNVTPTSSTLRLGSNTYDIGTATNIYVEDTGTYEIEAKTSNAFIFASNVVSGTIKTIEPALVGGNAHLHALAYDGKLYAWGINDDGELGLGDNTNKTTPTLYSGPLVSKILNKGWSGGNTRNETSWIKTVGNEVYATGKGDTYMIPGTSSDLLSFTNVTSYFGDQSLTSNNVVFVGGGERSCVALTESGNVWTWGTHDSAFWNLGQGTSASSSNTPKQITFGGVTDNISRVAFGHDHGVALDTDGDVWFWGQIWAGGASVDYPQTTLSDAQKSPHEIMTSNNIIGVSSTFFTIYAWQSDGTYYALGQDSHGQIGDGATSGGYTSWQKIEYFSANNITINEIYTGQYNVFADTSDGYYCWGYGASGAFGNGGTGNLASPTKWTNVSNIKLFSAGGSYMGAAITEDGKYYAWGSGSQTQRGDNDTGNITYPKYIDALPNILAPSFDFDGYDKVLAHMKPTSYVYEFFIAVVVGAVSENNELWLQEISSTGYSLKASMMVMNTQYRVNGIDYSAGTSVVSGLFDGSTGSTNRVGVYPGYHDLNQKIFTLTTSQELTNIVLSSQRPKYMPGWKIVLNGTTILEDSANNGTDGLPDPFTITKTLPPMSSSLTKYTKGTTTYDAGKASIVTVSDPGTYDAQIKSDTDFTLTSETVPATKASGLYTWAFHHGNFDNAYGDGDILTARDNGRFYADTPSYTGDIGTITPTSVSSFVYKFYCTVLPQLDTQSVGASFMSTTEISSTTTTLTSAMFVMADPNYVDPANGIQSVLFNGNINASAGYFVIKSYNDGGLAVDRHMFTITSPVELLQLSITTHRPGYMPGFKIILNDTHTLINETSNGGGSGTPSPYTKSHTFSSNYLASTHGTTYTFEPPSGGLTANVLMVAGGGGGGGRAEGGGGGAGGLVYTAGTSLAQGATKTIVVGNGDSGGIGSGSGSIQVGFNGKNTTFTGLDNAIGGGGGGSQNYSPKSGGSGGGGNGGNGSNYNFNTGASGTSSQGTAGGDGANTLEGGGGGGAGGVGATASSGNAGDGGIGKFFGTGSSFTDFGDEYGEGGYFAGGGGGGNRNEIENIPGGRGGGGYGGTSNGYMARGGSLHGMVHTGGGGGGAGTYARDQHPGYNTEGDGGVKGHGGRGGSGIVLIQTNVALPNGANTAVVQVGNPRRRSLPPAVEDMGSEVNRFYIIDSASMPTYKLPTHWYTDPVGRASNSVWTTQGSHSLQKRADGGTSNVFYVTSTEGIFEYGSYMAQTADAIFMPVEAQRYNGLLAIGSNSTNDIHFEMAADGTAALYYDNGATLLSAGTITCFTVGKWHHIALTVDSGGNAVGYVNGYPVVSGTHTSVAAVGSRSGNMHMRVGDHSITFRKFLTYEVSTYNFHMSPKQVLQRAAEVGLGPKLEYDGLNSINVVNIEKDSEITIYESNVNDTSNLYVVSCNESSYLLSNAGTYYAQIKGTDTFTIMRPLTVTEDHFPLYAYPPRDGTTTGLTTSTVADTWNTWTISGAANGNGIYQARSNRTATGTRNVYKAFSNNIGTGGIGEFQTVHSSGQHETGTLDLHLPSAKTIRKYVIWTTDSAFYTYNSTTYTDYDPTLPYNANERNYRRVKSWTIQGSNNDSVWTTIHTVTDKPPSIYGDVHTISSPGSYVYYRLNWSENNGSTETTTVAELIYWGDA